MHNKSQGVLNSNPLPKFETLLALIYIIRTHATVVSLHVIYILVGIYISIRGPVKSRFDITCNTYST